MRWKSAVTLAAVLAAAKLLFQLATLPGYGVFRDELYYLACAHRLAWGYVEFPPLTPLIARISTAVFGDGLFGIRFPMVLAGAAMVALTCVLARELGGGRFAQWIAGLAAFVAPIWLVAHHVLSPNGFEPLFWMGCAWLFIRWVKTGDSRLWLWFGLLAGIGLLNKHSMLFFGFALVAGMLLTPARKAFRERNLWLGGAVAFLIFLPHLVWQVRTGFPLIEFLTRAEKVKNYIMSPAEFFKSQVLLLNPVLLPLWLAGLAFFFTRPGKPWRALGWAYLVIFALMLALHGKPYYLVPAYPMLLAGGAIVLESAIDRRGWRRLKPALAAVAIVSGAALAPFAVPLLPPETFIAYAKAAGMSEELRTERHKMGPLPQMYADMFGWEDQARTIAGICRKLPPEEQARAVVFGQNYGEAAAIDYYRARYNLPPAISGHNNYWLWGPAPVRDVLIVIGGDPRDAREYFAEVEQVGAFYHPYAMPYENRPVWLCRKPKVDLRSLWPRLKHYE
jgi:hypothetical protein